MIDILKLSQKVVHELVLSHRFFCIAIIDVHLGFYGIHFGPKNSLLFRGIGYSISLIINEFNEKCTMKNAQLNCLETDLL